ncbi:MAG: CRTAC1 family protein [Rhodobacteraceae bacterium]|nr:CRTAC1 family protein [Paracoccaceae bacterium]
MIRALTVLLSLAAGGAAPADPIRFENMSARLIPHVYSGGWTHFVGGGLAVLDCNADGRPDMVAAGGSAPSTLFENLGEMRFSGRPLMATGPEGTARNIVDSTGAYPLDADGDGHMDLFVLRVGANLILRGDGACGFSIANALWGLDGRDRWSTAFSAYWDSAERLTLAVGNYVDRADPDGPFEACDTNDLYVREGRRFTWRSLAPGYCALSMLMARDAGGQLRLRISNDRHYYVRDGAEQMYDLRAGRFLGPGDGWPRISLWGMGIASRDITGDGRPEVMLTSMGDQVLQLAQPDGSYRAAPFDMGTYAQRPHLGDDGRPSTGWHAKFADVDNDGRADLFIAKGNVDQMPGNAIRDPNSLLRQLPDGRFTEVSVAAGVAGMERARGAALVDLDGDGRLDLAVVNRRAPMELYRNVTSAGNWLQIDLAQPGPNRNAVGARVTLQSASGRQVQDRVIGGGHAGGSAVPLHFGLGRDSGAKVSVAWPDGMVSDHALSANARQTIRKPAP